MHAIRAAVEESILSGGIVALLRGRRLPSGATIAPL
jgi:hypothetical protein